MLGARAGGIYPFIIVIAENEILAKIDDTITGSATPGKRLLKHNDGGISDDPARLGDGG